MSNDTATTTESFDALAKTNLLDCILSDVLIEHKNTEKTQTKLTLDEYQQQYNIILPAKLKDTWSNHGRIEYCTQDENTEEWIRNPNTKVHIFKFTVENPYMDYDLYSYITRIARHLKNTIEEHKAYLRNCFRVCSELIETHNNEPIMEIFFFDCFGNIDSIRFKITDSEIAINKAVNNLIKNKENYKDFINYLAERTEIPALPSKRRSLIEDYAHLIPPCLDGIHHQIKYGDHEWDVHEGDLVIDGNWQADNVTLIITGDLHVKGVYDAYSKGFSFVVVLGNMTAEHVICWYGLSVVGNLNVAGMVNIEHYMFPFEIGGDLHARSLSIKSEPYVHWKNLHADIAYYEDEYQGIETLKWIKPALLAHSYIESDLEAVDSCFFDPNFVESLEFVLSDQSPFRDAPLSDEIISKMDIYLKNKNNHYEDQQLIADIDLDPMLTLTIALLAHISPQVNKKIIKQLGIHGEGFDKALMKILQ